MRILHLSNDLTATGCGIVHVLVDLAVEQSRAGHEVVVAGPAGDYQDLFRRCGIRHVELRQRGVRNALRATWGLRRLVLRERLDIVHAHMVTGALIGRLATMGTRARLVTHVHNSFQRHAVLMGIGDRVIAVSDAVRAEMIGRGIAPRKISTVLNGTLGSARFSAPVEPGFALKRPALLTVAGMYERKGIADLLAAVALLQPQMPDVRLYLAGEGPDRPRFERMARDLGVAERTIFLGYRPDAEALMRQADVFVLASHADPNPLVISEARAAGLPIIATAVGGIPEALEQGACGMLVPARNPAMLSEALREVLQDPELRQSMAAAASKQLDRLHVARLSADTLRVYGDACGHPPAHISVQQDSSREAG